ncbi:molybdopterin oxidoreductase family protein [Clostridium tertium]|jgi:anaerobic selenocysteine-containing dehydrogenase|uniref:molybdopterin oxidoreductase family protein n=3 Tax=Clostridiaceae TaxID=31979 RepID=UPI001157CAEA|nr:MULTISPECIES: molybdopterin oxidoreductase family protein [Clostridium]MBS5306350.1 molybdopterin oxidoreductase family protein [Clostridium sp.]MDB1923943.1 molybdopterin oxidoreductase family protein [Clostridium tertium]MDB1927074.1 molybdopterin oxidoreductase family protein [Clostridium tertium]MDB1930786.1 molybdopterin oxidoreductase family protein [Clostridium tertium]MDB1943890.1 molybdopterin oxidoreductase family protein [Clostridium tertium]
MKKIQSTCNLCALACNIDFYVDNGKIQKVSPTVDYPVNKGFCCIKGLNLDKQQTKIKARKSPLLRDENGEMKEISWNKGFEVFAKKMTEIQAKYGKESVAYISTGQMTTEEMALLGHVGRNYMGMHGDGNTRLCMATSVVAHKQSFGFDAPPYTLNDAELSDTIILIGANPVIAHPVFWGRIRKNKDAKIITVDPRKSETAINSHMWVDIKPKSDLVLLYTLANVLIQNGWIDKKYIDEHTEGYEDFKNHVSKFTLDNVEEETGISKERVLELAEIIHNGKRVSFWWTMGVNQGYQAVRTAQSIINLALITGNIGRPGTGANSLTGQCNAMGSRAFSNTAGLYGGGDFDNPVRRKAVAEALEVDESVLATKPTLPYNAIIEKAIAGEIKGLWVICTNPRHSFTNNDEFKKAVENLDFLVVQDIYEDTHTAQLCDLYLPSVPAIKKEGVLINTERRLSKVNPVIPKEEGELSDFEIFLNIGKALGMGSLLDNWKTPRDVFELLKKCSKGMPCDITGVTYEMLEGKNMEGSRGVQWPFKEGQVIEEDERRLYEDGNYYTQSKKAKFHFEDIAENPTETSKEFPYILNTGRGTVGQWHTQVRSREIEHNKIYRKESYVLMNPDLARELNINENERVNITSQNGNTNEFNVVYSENVKKDHIYAPMHYIETNSLTPSVYDPYSKEPSFKTVAVNIFKK